MSFSADQSRKIIPAQLGFLAIYNPSLGTTDETLENQIVYYSSAESREAGDQLKRANTKTVHDSLREQNNEQLRQIGLAQGMVEFGRSFSDGSSVDTVETEKTRIILHELEAGWWILASINLTVLPSTQKPSVTNSKSARQDAILEYSSREVKPAILLLGDLLRAHSTFLLHHASSLSALFVRTRRSKFIGILGRYWDTYLSTWNVLMHGNPANSLYGGIKVAACGELGVGVGEEERGSGEREVLEGFVGRIDGLVDVIVSKFGDVVPAGETEPTSQDNREAKPTDPWLGSGNEPAADDGAVFLGTGALSRKSLRDVSHWIEELYRWGPLAYGVVDNPSSNRRTKSSKQESHGKRGETPTASERRTLSPEAKKMSRQVYGLNINDKSPSRPNLTQDNMASPGAKVDETPEASNATKASQRRPSLQRGASSFNSTDSESRTGNKFVKYLKLGYGTHWSLGGSTIPATQEVSAEQSANGVLGENQAKSTADQSQFVASTQLKDEFAGHYLIGLKGEINGTDEELVDTESPPMYSVEQDGHNARLLLRTLTVELEREEDARAEADISIDLGTDQTSSKITGSEHTGTSNTSFESQDRNKTKKLRVIVYVRRPFVFVFLFELRTDSLALSSLYRSLHQQIGTLMKPLLASTAFRASRPNIAMSGDISTPIYDLMWDPTLLTVNSTIPNIPDPCRVQPKTGDTHSWSRIEALNTHMQVINTYIATTINRADLERTCKTSRGWWVVWTRIPDADTSTSKSAPAKLKVPGQITEDYPESRQSSKQGFGSAKSRGSTFGTSMASGPAHPFLETPSNGNQLNYPKDKEIFLIRKASDHSSIHSSNKFVNISKAGSEASWTAGPGKLVQGIGVDTKRYIEALLNLNQ